MTISGNFRDFQKFRKFLGGLVNLRGGFHARGAQVARGAEVARAQVFRGIPKISVNARGAQVAPAKNPRAIQIGPPEKGEK